MPGTRIAKRTQFLPEDLAKKAVIHCHSGVAVLCVLCVSAVELPFCKTKPIKKLRKRIGALLVPRCRCAGGVMAGEEHCPVGQREAKIVSG
jgi:hypothetical protein